MYSERTIAIMFLGKNTATVVVHPEPYDTVSVLRNGVDKILLLWSVINLQLSYASMGFMFEAALFFYDISRSLIPFHQSAERNCGGLSDGMLFCLVGFWSKYLLQE